MIKCTCVVADFSGGEKVENDDFSTGLKMESLRGQFLLATPQMTDPRFREQIILICSHNEDGAMGFIVNQPSPFDLGEIFEGAKLEIPEGDLSPVHIGGPVEMTAAFFLFSSEYETVNYLDVNDRIRISGDSGILYDIAKGRGPKDFLFLLGYAGWGPGQLESELTMNSWLTLPAEYDDVFHTPDALKWKKVAARHGIDISLLGSIVGNA